MWDHNGISLIPQLYWSEPDAILSTDACLSGCGGVLKVHNFFFSLQVPSFCHGAGIRY